jgi:hypothetical protein
MHGDRILGPSTGVQVEVFKKIVELVTTYLRPFMLYLEKEFVL